MRVLIIEDEPALASFLVRTLREAAWAPDTIATGRGALEALAGLVALAFGMGAGAELQQPLATAAMGERIISTAVTLLLLPTALEAVGALQSPMSTPSP